MKKTLILMSMLLSMTHVYANSDIKQLETILENELSQLPVNTELSEDFVGSSGASKSDSIRTMMNSLQHCQNQTEMKTESTSGMGFKTIAVSCRDANSELSTSEFTIRSDENGQPTIAHYQELKFEEKPILPSVHLNIMASPDLEIVRLKDAPSAGIRALLSIAKVAVPMSLSLKTAKVLFPTRSDWQKHFVAGAIMSGATVLIAETIVRRRAKEKGEKPSELKVALISSLSGLLFSMAIGGIKEWSDSTNPKKHSTDWQDFLYTAAGGAFVSVSYAIPLNNLFYKKRKEPVRY